MYWDREKLKRYERKVPNRVKYMEKNIYEAIKWYEKAAKMGNSEAQFCLARLMYEDALHWFEVGIEYPDALPYIEENATKMLELLEKHKKKAEQKNSTLGGKYANLNIGDKFNFGKYNGQPITWRILKKYEKSMYVLADKILGHRQFDASSNRWDNSEIRKWLNSDFYNEAFSEDEKSFICNMKGDNVTLLSKNEAKSLMSSQERMSDSWWWLRSPTPYSSDTVYIVVMDGSFLDNIDVGSNLVVRPAFYLKL